MRLSQARWRIVVGFVVVAGVLLLGVSGGLSADFHGIAFVKGCDTPTKIGDPYNCAYSILNVVDTAHDTEQITGLSDVVHSAGGDVGSGDILPSLQLIFSGAVTCTGGSGT